VDEVDRRILQKLSVNARASLDALARAVNLAPSSVKRRIDRLEHTAVIRGYTVILDRTALGHSVQALIEVFATNGTLRPPLLHLLAAHPEVERAWAVTGDADALALVRVRSVEHLDQLLLRLQHTGTVARTRTQVLLDELLNRDTKHATGLQPEGTAL
jgi:DNA-binding Lrp family transcriptional regulator